MISSTSFPVLMIGALMAGMVATSATAQVSIDRADIESWVDVPITMYSWDANDNVSGSAIPDTAALTAIIAGGDANFTSIVRDLKKNGTSVLRRISSDMLGADSFPTATHVEQHSFKKAGSQEDSTINRFSVLTDDAQTYLGFAIDGIDTDQDGVQDTVVGRYTPSGWKDRALPGGVGRTWQSSHTQKMWIKAKVIGWFQVVGATEEREYEITRATTLTTPAATAPAIAAHMYEFITHAQSGTSIALERFSFITESGVAVTVAYKLDNKQSRLRTGINDIAYFVPESISSGVAERKDVESARLGGNYPNPCASFTEIPFSLAAPGHVRLTVCNALGEEVARLLDASMPAGRHVAEFQPNDLPGGFYTYRLQMGERIISRTMILRK